ncbi:12653_t:CDS:1 [Ambispora leptoticha]|uniref:12653_t:CDS:1 n=1 Tax=Ambispora leptoticha TaxID=144679 RepID=A0A9N8V8H2_9GLOM|nr:12653_t:CDS:1 [Ambispora leptoticha]
MGLRQNPSSSAFSSSSTTTSSTSPSQLNSQQVAGQPTQQSTTSTTTSSPTVSSSNLNNNNPFSPNQSHVPPFYEQTTEFLQGVTNTYVISDTSPSNAWLIHYPTHTINTDNFLEDAYRKQKS